MAADYTWEQAMTTFNVAFDWIITQTGNRNDQRAWSMVYWLVDNFRIVMGNTPTSEQLQEAYENT